MTAAEAAALRLHSGWFRAILYAERSTRSYG
jgi:hypothetical protein